MDKNCYHISSVIQSYLEELDYRYQNRGQPLGLSTGIKTLDERMEWMRNGEVISHKGKFKWIKITIIFLLLFNLIWKNWIIGIKTEANLLGFLRE